MTMIKSKYADLWDEISAMEINDLFHTRSYSTKIRVRSTLHNYFQRAHPDKKFRTFLFKGAICIVRLE